MCGRYNIIDDPSVHQLLKHLNVDLGPLPTRWNLAPTDQVPVVHLWEQQRVISDMRWWLTPHWSNGPSQQYAMFNARRESLMKSRAFHGCFRHKRCIIPAHSFVEWQRLPAGKTPYVFAADEQSLAFAGLWDYWTDGTQHVFSCAIITTEAAPEFESYHKRMPVMLSNDDADTWLNEHHDVRELQPLLEPKLPYDLTAAAIDERYNNARNKTAPVLLEAPSFITPEL